MDACEEIRRNLEQVQARMAEAALRVGRTTTDVRLVAVSKTHPAEAVLAAWECGQRDFGENRPEEGAEKIPVVAGAVGTARPTWHMIGTIQRRKADLVVAHFDYIHSVDRLVLAKKLSSLAVAAGKVLPVLIECNVSGEESKAGYSLYGWEHESKVRAPFFREVAVMVALPGLRVEGLMTMAPLAAEPETVRPVFASLRGLREALQERLPQATWRHLSMGMTDDFEVAIEEGATLVRVGRAIFGQRQV